MDRARGYRYLDPTALAKVKNLSIAARGVVEGFITGLHKSPYRGFSVEFAEHRNYAPGDNPRHLDWRLLARTDRLYIKQYEEETNLRAQIVLDCSASMHYRFGPVLTKFEYGAYLTAVLAYLMTRQQDAVGLTTFDSELRLDMPARSTPRHFGDMMRKLEGLADGAADALLPTARPAAKDSAGAHVADTLHRLAERFKRRCLVVVISDLYDEPEAVARALHHFRHKRHEVLLFHVLDQAEIDFPFRDSARFLDLETGETLQADPQHVRQEYQRQLNEFLNNYKKVCGESQVDYVLAGTSTPYDTMLSRYLSVRNRAF